MKKEDTKGCAHRSEVKNAEPTASEEPIRVYVSGYMAQSPTPRHCVAQQLQTPPNTLVGRKKERPPSWEADQQARKRLLFVDYGSTLEADTGLQTEHSLAHFNSHKALSTATTPRHKDVSSLTDSSSASEAVLTRDCSAVAANNTSSAQLSPGDHKSQSSDSDGNRPFGDTAAKVDSNGQTPVANENEDYSGASPVLFDNCGGGDDVASNKIYPQLPVRKNSGSADLDVAASNDRRKSTDFPTATVDHFSPALDYIALDTSSDFGDFHEDLSVPDRISVTGPRTEPHLCDEQLALVDLVMSGKNVFYTGSAGCGKSTVLKHFVTLFRREGKKVDIVAPTGRAALEVNGRTLYNYAGWVPRSLAQPLGDLEQNAWGDKVWKRLDATDALIIDEISMVANHLFERLNCIMKYARHSTKPFGGVQVIVTGDFCQLPPVNAFEYCLKCGTALRTVLCKEEYECINVKCKLRFEEIDKWAFRSAAWQECEFEHVNLKVIHRQKDAVLKALLEERRLGRPYTFDQKLLLLDHTSDTKDAVKLFPRKAEVKFINDMELAQLPGQPLTYLSLDDFYWWPEHDNLGDKRERCPKPMGHALVALEEHSFEPRLVLKEGMLVMLVVNWDLDSNLANGSQGTIVGFEEHNHNLLPEVPRDREYSSCKNGLVRAFINRAAVRKWPIVQFLNGRRRTIYPRCLMNELGDTEPYSLLSRTQIPLIAAWAMTVHKAQGMTLSRVIVDLRLSFEPGQEYVALSRAETLKGLKVEGLPKKFIGPNTQVIEFLEENNLMPAFDYDESNDAKSDYAQETG